MRAVGLQVMSLVSTSYGVSYLLVSRLGMVLLDRGWCIPLRGHPLVVGQTRRAMSEAMSMTDVTSLNPSQQTGWTHFKARGQTQAENGLTHSL